MGKTGICRPKVNLSMPRGYMSMNPIEIAKALKESYRRYLETSFHLKDPALLEQFRGILEDKSQPPLVREPILEISPGYKNTISISELISQGILSELLNKLDSVTLGRSLYSHQERALRKAITENRNLVVATGTGSGKTESFLYPILNHLLRESENGTLQTPGVRALLLYPMNALANDQIARLREIVRLFPDITFGRYTGETQEEYKPAVENYREFHNREDPLPNELICRAQMRETPPHILFTNYAMLEYLLIRPVDSELFRGGQWRFLVLDEVHTYSGALGIEIAMLLRRLKERVVLSEKGRLQCMATSATLGNGERDFPKIANFATDLFGEDFDTGDIISADRVQLDADTESWGKGSGAMYDSLCKIIFDQENYALNDIANIARSYVPASVLNNALTNMPDASRKEAAQDFVFSILKGDKQVQSLRKQLNKEGALELNKIDSIDKNILINIVALGSFARKPDSQIPLIPARYHIMTRAISGISGWIDSTGKLQLLPRRQKSHIANNGKSYAVFEVAKCNRCGEVMLVGEEQEIDGRSYLVEPPDVGDDPIADLSWFLLNSISENSNPDEDDIVEAEEELEKQRQAKLSPMSLCQVCGRLDDASTFNPSDCDRHEAEFIPIYKIENKKKRNVPKQCPSCGNIHGNVASRVLTGKEVPVAVLATSLYQKIPSSLKSEEANLPGGGRKLMMFSDSRQDAAFFAPFMNTTYNKFKQRRYLMQALGEMTDPIDLEYWARLTRNKAEIAGEWDEDSGPNKRKREAASWVLREWIAIDRKLALEGTGSVIFHLRKPGIFTKLPLLSEAPYNLSENDQWTLIQILIDSVRYQGIVSFNTDEFSAIEPTDKTFAPRNVACYIRGASGNSKKRIYAWEPAQNRSNKRLDYVVRLLQRRGCDSKQSYYLAHKVIVEIWNAINHSNGPLNKLFEQGLRHNSESNLARLKPDFWQVERAGDNNIFRCDTCGTVTAFTIENVCPMYRCIGHVKLYSMESRQNNHYYNLFTTMTPTPLKVHEHTAQINKEEASKIQQDFIAGKVNMLSCTTTFEMGVDVGNLQTVFMRNMPPNPGNYVQRAGRAGRRADNVAIILSFAQRRPHDFAYFDKWERMIQGSIRPPAIHLNNTKIIRRHVHAEALTAYFHDNPDVFKDKLESMFDPENCIPDELKSYLMKQPDKLYYRLKHIVPIDLHDVFGLETWKWLHGHGSNEEEKRETFCERLSQAVVDVQGDWNNLKQAEDKASQEKKHADAGSFQRQLNTLKRRSLLGKLGTYGLMPKYGFPTEVVELKIRTSSKESGMVELERDMKLALSEFAPGNQVIAGGKVWTSVGIVIPAGDRRLHEYKYWHHNECKYFSVENRIAIEAASPETKRCNCNENVEAKTYIYPEFGFTTAMGKSDDVGEERPAMKSYSASFFHDDGNTEEPINFPDIQNVRYRLLNKGWIHVINDNHSDGFFICKICGYVSPVNPIFSSRKNTTHFKPWTSDQSCSSSNSYMQKLDLGYRYRTDVLELFFPKPSIKVKDMYSLWLSVLYAIVNGACQVLDINERDLEGCLHYKDLYPSLVLYDTAPGGAGFVEDVKANFKTVVEKAFSILNCKYCNEDSSCIACLRNYYNQRDHNRLRRGYALGYFKQFS